MIGGATLETVLNCVDADNMGNIVTGGGSSSPDLVDSTNTPNPLISYIDSSGY